MSDTIQLKNADGSSATRLSKDKYDAVKTVLLKTIPKSKTGVPFKDLAKHVQKGVPKEMLPAKGSASWLTTTVKLDLEGRGVIERIEGSTPQRVRRIR